MKSPPKIEYGTKIKKLVGNYRTGQNKNATGQKLNSGQNIINVHVKRTKSIQITGQNSGQKVTRR